MPGSRVMAALATGLLISSPLRTAAAQDSTVAVGLSLLLNLPSYRLEVYESGRLTHRYRVAIGDTAFPTPTGVFEISRVEWDPWWVPPKSEWAAKDSITPPGAANPMGRVKLFWQDLYFVHGTPKRGSVGAATSHGCVRMLNGDAVSLAKVVHRYGSPGIPDTLVKAWAAAAGKTQVVALERSVPLEIRYDVAVVRNDTLVVYPDVYRRYVGDMLRQALAAIGAAGYDPSLVDPEPLETRLHDAERRVTTIPVECLLRKQ